MFGGISPRLDSCLSEFRRCKRTLFKLRHCPTDFLQSDSDLKRCRLRLPALSESRLFTAPKAFFWIRRTTAGQTSTERGLPTEREGRRIRTLGERMVMADGNECSQGAKELEVQLIHRA